ncbi:NACHT and WD repeat domain-containing protein 2-like [Melanotaenia boesemani]|uniref:NACHT and WD repeat domain-containing protein 2-like n=1 Tax=Melanotaenia boesemani TaxID=1250792 RepID=UPI001C0546B1|nr:NACHT and WD repeat domain-containing protein 2-like [Melanotaenia boesemani]
MKQNPSFIISSDPDSPSCITSHSELISNCSPTSILDCHHEGSTKEQVSYCSNELSTKPYQDLRRPNSDTSLSELEEHLASLLTLLPSSKQPLILILDGLDQLENSCNEQIIRSLPSSLPPGVKLILTISSNRARLLQAIKLHYPQGSGQKTGSVCAQLGSVERKQCVKMLAPLLRGSGRKVTSGQQALVKQALTSCCLPLYARLLHAHTSLWHSGTTILKLHLLKG